MQDFGEASCRLLPAPLETLVEPHYYTRADFERGGEGFLDFILKG